MRENGERERKKVLSPQRKQDLKKEGKVLLVAKPAESEQLRL